MENPTQGWIISRPFFPKSGHFFRFKKVGEASSFNLNFAPVSVAEYASNPRMYLIISENA